jgi:hypothetical protein
MEFGQRVQRLCAQLLAIIEASDRGLYEKEDLKEEATEIGLQEFIFGLRPPLDIQVRIEKPNSLTKAIRIATDLEFQQAARRTDNGRRANTWMGPAQISQRPVYSYNNTPPLINNENLNNRPIIDNRPRKMEERKRPDIARCQYCNRLGHIASECRILAEEG